MFEQLGITQKSSFQTLWHSSYSIVRVLNLWIQFKILLMSHKILTMTMTVPIMTTTMTTMTVLMMLMSTTITMTRNVDYHYHEN